MQDLAYTLSERRSHHFHRAYIVAQDSSNFNEGDLVFGKKSLGTPKIGFVFTGQGAQWPQMGKELVDTFPSARSLLKRLGSVLTNLPDGPSWSLLEELVEPRKSQHLRQPEFSQPLVTALQLAILEILSSWGIKPQAVVGHSSGEIAAACAAGYLTKDEAIKAAFYRGKASVLDQAKASLGMLAVGLSAEKVEIYIHDLYPSVQIGCFNSPNSITLSGDLAGLETVKGRLEKDSHFARILQVDLAYHSKFMADIGQCYEGLLQQNCNFQSAKDTDNNVTMYSSVTGNMLDRACDIAYWKSNMVSPVLFDQAVQEMLSTPEGPDFLIEIGPSGALAGPITQIKDKLQSLGQASQVQYCSALTRGKDSVKAMFDVAGQLFISGGAIDLAKALVLEKDSESRTMLNLNPHPGPKASWYDFRISSSTDGLWIEHCSGMIRLEKPFIEVASREELAPLKHTTSGASWYKAANAIGYGFGPAFQKQIFVESVTGKQESRSHVSLTEPLSTFKQSPYSINPACIDGCFQTVTPSLWDGDRSTIDTVLVPAIIDDLVINKVTKKPEYGISITNSKYSDRGRKDEKRNYHSNCSVYDPETGELLLKLSGLRYHKLDTGVEIGAAHTFTRSMWKPDITFLSPIQLASLSVVDGATSILHQIIDLIAHKKPTLKVMEIDMDLVNTSSVWFEGINTTPRLSRKAYSQYAFICADANSLITMQEDLGSHRNSTFNLLDITKADFNPPDEFDLVIIKGDRLSAKSLGTTTKNARNLLVDGGHMLIVENSSTDSDSGLGSDSLEDGVDDESTLDLQKIPATIEAAGFNHVGNIPTDTHTSVYLSIAAPNSSPISVSQSLVVTSLSDQPPMEHETRSALKTAGWEVLEHSRPLRDIQPKSTVMIQDDLSGPVLTSVTEKQWEQLKFIISLGCKILWVTQGSQMDVTNPDNSLIHGMFRTIRAEDPSLCLVTLDLESGSNSTTSSSVIVDVLKRLQNLPSKILMDSEFVERGGIVYVNRIIPDMLLNQVRQDESHGGTQPIVKSLGDSEPIASLRAERLGCLDALRYVENSVIKLPVLDGNVEVSIVAAGLNFKDVIVSQGIFPENEHLLGLEGAGIITSVGKGAEKFKVGDRVAMLARPTFVNKVQCPIERMHLMPPWLSFEDAATIPLVYLTSIYSLFDIGNLKKGQSVLIHSAAGGVGMACIYLARYIGAEIYVTVGSDEKRKFLKDTFGISEDRMFSSRTTDFARKIMTATDGKGTDVIINSLVGELLDESWRICADGGTMVEIGKKDIVDRNYLSMEPFDRNCSFRPVDFSYKQISDEQIATTMSQCFDLLQEGHIKPIRPITTFGFDNIPEAFAYMRSGRHVGKIVISDGDNGITSQVPIRPAMRQLDLRDDVSYMIVGGLKGLCGSLAVHLATKGAKHIISMSRSGISDERSQAIVKNCNALGCDVQEARADVSNAEDVERAFKEASLPIGGIIQGAMVLRFHTTISNKVQGTWNLHNSAKTHSSPITFFTLLSSISGVLGQKGQVNYAAANVFMDAFAIYRQSLNLPANSLDLGVIEDVGYVAEQGGMTQHFDDKLWTGINETMLRRVLNYSILQQTQPIEPESAAQLITGISVPQPPDSDLARDARFSSLFTSTSSNPGSSGGKGANEEEKQIQAFMLLYEAKVEKSTLVQAVVNILSKQFMKTLRLTEELEQARSLSAYGLDSLSAVEVRNWIRVNLGAEVTTLDINNAGSLWSLGEKVVGKLAVLE
ncbi:hypothetical protein BPAE_0387g00010 [Botrytis paeoniae]|uniref:Uncharacterized protein n=1 Tax=Botrytis paeoniae TaxID=278948 RepID=A0A4Z1F5W5_9HELO|nr:hypothetical protein BPAE_0387g00010 [Botrytis paeoniae]